MRKIRTTDFEGLQGCRPVNRTAADVGGWTVVAKEDKSSMACRQREAAELLGRIFHVGFEVALSVIQSDKNDDHHSEFRMAVQKFEGPISPIDENKLNRLRKKKKFRHLQEYIPEFVNGVPGRTNPSGIKCGVEVKPAPVRTSKVNTTSRICPSCREQGMRKDFRYCPFCGTKLR